jgi:hypothetical protein
MEIELEQLARRAVACKGWRWMPGMLAVHHQDYGNNGLDGRVIEIDDKEGPMWIGWGDLYLPLFEGSWPDLTDPATIGCLLALVREAHNAPHAWVETRYGQRSRVVSPEGYSEATRMLCEWQVGTEAAALVAALERL